MRPVWVCCGQTLGAGDPCPDCGAVAGVLHVRFTDARGIRQLIDASGHVAAAWPATEPPPFVRLEA